MDNRSVFNWCLIGTGTLAKKAAKVVLPSGRHRFAAVYTRDHQKGLAFAAKYGGTAYDHPEAAVTAPDVDGVYIVTPHTSHYEYARLALSLGKPVLCEKPITVTAREAAELFALAEEKGVYLAEAMWTWFSPVAWKVKEWVDAGELGGITRAQATYRCDSRGYAPRCSDPNAAGGALLDIGVYPITYLYRLFGYPAAIRCAGRLEGGIDLSEDVELTFPGGLVCPISISMAEPAGHEELRLEGGRASVICPSYHCAVQAELVRREGGSEVFRGDGGYRNEFDVVAGEIRAGLARSTLVPPGATVDVMKIMDECRRQMGLVYPFERG